MATQPQNQSGQQSNTPKQAPLDMDERNSKRQAGAPDSSRDTDGDGIARDGSRTDAFKNDQQKNKDNRH